MDLEKKATASGTTGLFDLPDYMFKKFDICLAKRTITGGVFFEDPKQTTTTAASTPTTNFTVNFGGVTVRTAEEATDLKRVFDCKHVVSVRFRKNGGDEKEVDVSAFQAKSVPLLAFVNDFSGITVTCAPGAWDLRCLNSPSIKDDGELPVALVDARIFAAYIMRQGVGALVCLWVAFGQMRAKEITNVRAEFELLWVILMIVAAALAFSTLSMIADMFAAYGTTGINHPRPERFFLKFMWAGLKPGTPESFLPPPKKKTT